MLQKLGEINDRLKIGQISTILFLHIYGKFSILSMSLWNQNLQQMNEMNNYQNQTAP